MRRVTLMLAAMAMMVSLFAAVAYAATINGTRVGETLIETTENDKIHGHGGSDFIDAGFFIGDTDVVFGGKGRDGIDVHDGDNLDTVYGGKGRDHCIGDPRDQLDCEVQVVPK